MDVRAFPAAGIVVACPRTPEGLGKEKRSSRHGRGDVSWHRYLLATCTDIFI